MLTTTTAAAGAATLAAVAAAFAAAAGAAAAAAAAASVAFAFFALFDDVRLVGRLDVQRLKSALSELSLRRGFGAFEEIAGVSILCDWRLEVCDFVESRSNCFDLCPKKVKIRRFEF